MQQRLLSAAGWARQLLVDWRIDEAIVEVSATRIGIGAEVARYRARLILNSRANHSGGHLIRIIHSGRRAISAGTIRSGIAAPIEQAVAGRRASAASSTTKEPADRAVRTSGCAHYHCHDQHQRQDPFHLNSPYIHCIRYSAHERLAGLCR